MINIDPLTRTRGKDQQRGPFLWPQPRASGVADARLSYPKGRASLACAWCGGVAAGWLKELPISLRPNRPPAGRSIRLAPRT